MSLADCVPKPTMPLSLRIVFSLSLTNAGKLVVVEDLPAFVDEHHHRAPVHQALDPMENITERRRSDVVVVEHFGQVEADNAVARAPEVDWDC